VEDGRRGESGCGGETGGLLNETTAIHGRVHKLMPIMLCPDCALNNAKISDLRDCLRGLIWPVEVATCTQQRPNHNAHKTKEQYANQQSGIS